jgi:hypothetical protein
VGREAWKVCRRGRRSELVDEEEEAGYPEHRGGQTRVLLSRSEWAYDQKKLAQKLGLKRVSKYLGRVCDRCGKPAPKHAKLDLCEEHREQHKREVTKRRVQKFRARQKHAK